MAMKEKQYKHHLKSRRKEGKLRIHAKFKPIILHSLYFMKRLNEKIGEKVFRGCERGADEKAL